MDLYFRFNDHYYDLNNVIITLTYNFEEQCTALLNNWYEKIKTILIEKKSTDGVALKGIPQFLKCITYTISLTVRYN